MLEYTYLLFNLVVLLPPLLISVFSDVKTYKNWRAIGLSLLAVSLPFILWDIWAAAHGHWFFSSTYITAPRPFGIPIEEILFFVTVPFAMCFVWDVLAKYISNKPVSEVLAATGVALASLMPILLLLTQWSRGYTRSAAIAMALALVAVVASGWWRRNRFWWFQLILFTIFFIANTFLTALPVITYGDASAIGYRIGTIPLEDFLFNFALINLFVITYDYFCRKLTNK
jgi:lycopene cyclase domain-containing protein